MVKISAMGLLIASIGIVFCRGLFQDSFNLGEVKLGKIRLV
jgi:hypothetical protein